MIVRPGRPDDAERLPAIEASAGRAFLQSDMPWIAHGDLTSADSHHQAIAAETHWVAEADGGALAGFVACEALADRLHIWELAVALEHQRKGLGSRLVAAAAENARVRALPQVTLTTFRRIAWNGPYYARLGFADVDPGDDPWLADILRREAKRGLTDRVAMRLAL